MSRENARKENSPVVEVCELTTDNGSNGKQKSCGADEPANARFHQTLIPTFESQLKTVEAVRDTESQMLTKIIRVYEFPPFVQTMHPSDNSKRADQGVKRSQVGGNRPPLTMPPIVGENDAQQANPHVKRNILNMRQGHSRR